MARVTRNCLLLGVEKILQEHLFFSFFSEALVYMSADFLVISIYQILERTSQTTCPCCYVDIFLANQYLGCNSCCLIKAIKDFVTAKAVEERFNSTSIASTSDKHHFCLHVPRNSS
uniref:Uncharacterized protein n=1 Tax=Octopus bimaculoides TaxID=37653 RepID=A0A0L8FRI2_OCTBM